MEYGLARLVLGSNKFVEINKKDYEEIKFSRDILLESLFIEQKFDLLIDNYVEFETDLLEIGAGELIRGSGAWADFQDQRNQINRRLVNLLSAARLYLDHTKHHLGNIERFVPGVKSSIELTMSTQYDESLGYRFMEALRNYVQHRGYPIHGVTYGVRRTNLGAAYTVTPYIEWARLEEDGKFKSTVLSELKSLSEKIDIRPFVREYMERLWNIQQMIRSKLDSILKQSDRLVRQAITRYRDESPVNDSIVGLAAVTRDGQTYAGTIPLFEDLLDYRKSFEKKNRSLTNLEKRYVSGEIARREKS
ncbi:MAG: hypothetical protein ACO1PM_18260 [Acidovorax sp.]